MSLVTEVAALDCSITSVYLDYHHDGDGDVDVDDDDDDDDRKRW